MSSDFMTLQNQLALQASTAACLALAFIFKSVWSPLGSGCPSPLSKALLKGEPGPVPTQEVPQQEVQSLHGDSPDCLILHGPARKRDTAGDYLGNSWVLLRVCSCHDVCPPNCLAEEIWRVCCVKGAQINTLVPGGGAEIPCKADKCLGKQTPVESSVGA